MPEQPERSRAAVLRRARRTGPGLVRGAVLGPARGAMLRRDRSVRITLRPGAELVTGRWVHLNEGVRIAVGGTPERPARLQIGERTSIGSRTVINVGEELVIGSRCMIGWECNLLDTDFHQIVEEDGSRPPVTARTEIGDHVWLGTRVTVLKGVSIGAGAVIGAGSLVTQDIPAGVLAAGHPAKVVRPIRLWI